LLAAVVVGAIHCDSSKSKSTQSTGAALTSAGDGSAAGHPQPTSSAEANREDASPGASRPNHTTAPADWFACKTAQDCTVVYETSCCVPDCDPLLFAGYVAVNSKHRADFIGHIGCTDVQCKKCPTPLPDVARSDSNFFALCQQGRCEAVDLRYSKYSRCETVNDCKLRFGLGCCEACGDKDLVTYNRSSTLEAELCPTKAKCPPLPPECKKLRSSHQHPECVLNYCQLGD
jgi:hypothetical protein